MIDCLFILNADGLWKCSQCGWVYPRAADTPPRRNCPKTSNEPKPPQPTRRERLLARYDAAETTDPPRAEVERRAAACEACEEYEGYACITMGSPCRKPARWQEKVLFGMCEKLKP